MAPTRIPTETDFAPILPTHPAHRPNQHEPSSSSSSSPLSLTYPDPAESTTSILVLFHGLGDSSTPFANLARNLALPGVLAISVRGTAPLPALLLADADSGEQGYHWGDDLSFSSASGEVDADPGFERASRWVIDRLIGEVLVGKCGWGVGDVMLFGFGQGGSLALGLASRLRTGVMQGRVVEGEHVMEGGRREDGETERGRKFKGVVSIGGVLPMSMVPTVSGLGRAKTPVLVCCGRESEAVDEDAVELLEREFEEVRVVRWERPDDGMPRNRDEALPMMQFFAERLRSGWL
ncbi:alpha/beta-hydrolase [Parathielavia hyrcaniae]|uniref:Alpha/beta-hydrolase n=1 Tax=Parathielavia hyrcaniae TaxID=113614 RepID=A0AAN6T4L4_9PEZI|nr:alpha/beta-hydrolase [Parathielavia hyrcaniae]